MAKNTKEGIRSQLGYGSSYHKGRVEDLDHMAGIGTVLGGQVWMVKPDERAETKNPCIWMQAGVVAFKNCNNFGDCTSCKYDAGMRKRVEQDKETSWQDALRDRGGLGRTCRHSLTQRIGARSCAYNYECSRCDFDQFFEDVWTTKTKSVPFEVQKVKGFQVPMGYYYHDGHTWVRIESGGYIRIGMDDFAMRLLGRPDDLHLPLMGKELHKDKAGWGLKRKGNHADVLSPINGVIVEVNSKLREDPHMTHREPYEEGWLFMVRTPDIKGTAEKLMTDTQGLDWTGREVNRLEEVVEGVTGPLAADGGYLGDDIYGNLPGLDWKTLTRTFLRT